jgi:hypothetical protein
MAEEERALDVVQFLFTKIRQSTAPRKEKEDLTPSRRFSSG